jgi:6,7-dimethyl-8-ribityllumazine synthase
MVASARQALETHGIKAEDITVIMVPGAFELPAAAEALAASGKFAGIIALGAVIRGATAHFDFVAAESSRGLMDVSLRHRCAVSFGVLTTDTVEQALERASPDAGNKGYDVAVAALEMADLLHRIRDLSDGEN